MALGNTSGGFTSALGNIGVNYFNPTSTSDNGLSGAGLSVFGDNTPHGNSFLSGIGGTIGTTIGSIWGPIGQQAGGAAGTDIGTTFGDAIDGNWSNVGNDILNSLVPKDPFSGQPLSNDGGGLFGNLFGGGSGSSSSSASNFFTDIFLRATIIILGFIFVAVGLTMFKNGNNK